MCRGSWRRCTAVVQEPTLHIQQNLIKLLIRFMLCFFTFFWFQLSLLQVPSCKQHLSFLQEQPFRLLVWGCWTPDFPFYLLDSPLYHSRHSTPDCQPCKGAASLLASCWECVFQPAWCSTVVLCMQALGVLSDFGCAALPVQAQSLLFLQRFIFCICCLALVQNTRWVVTVFCEEDFQHFSKLLHAALGDVLFFPESPNYHFHGCIIITASFHSAVSPYHFYSSHSKSVAFAVKTCLSLLFLFFQSCWMSPEPFRNLPLWFVMMCFHYSLPHHERSCRSRRNLSFSSSYCFREFPPK